jgi:hypothetical protein
MVLLSILATVFIRSAWRAARDLRRSKHATEGPDPTNLPTTRKGSYLLGLTFALTSPWNIGFWLAVIGGQRSLIRDPSLFNSIILASSVVLGAMALGCRPLHVSSTRRPDFRPAGLANWNAGRVRPGDALVRHPPGHAVVSWELRLPCPRLT